MQQGRLFGCVVLAHKQTKEDSLLYGARHHRDEAERNRDGIAEILKKFVQRVNFYPFQGAYGEGNNNFLIFILFKDIKDGGESIDSVNADYSAS